MATPGRRTDTCVADQLLEKQPFAFNFFQAVRLLNRIFADRRPLGKDYPANEEVVRFRGDHSLTFSPSSIRSLDISDTGQPEMSVSFMGLTGRQGVLPFPYTETVIDAGKPATDFFDLFLHRLVSFFFCSWEKHSLIAQFETEALGRRDEPLLSQYFFDLFGLGTGGLRSRLPGIDDRSLIYYSGLFAQRPRSANALETILSDYFQVHVSVEQFVGQWLTFDESEYTDLQVSAIQNCLGDGATLGDAIWNPQAGIRLHVGPLSWVKNQFQAFLPDGEALPKMIALTRFFLDWNLDFDIQLILLKAEVPDWILSDEGPNALRLGLSTWLRTADFDEDARDVVLPAGYPDGDS